MKTALFLSLSIFLTGCEQVLIQLPNTFFEKSIDPYFNIYTARYMKSQLIESCSAQDPQCIEAVEMQFDSCHETYKVQWTKYMNSNSRNEDFYLAKYSTNLYACITDNDGNPYFEFNPDTLP
jgi:hypothetical protein